jgi:hypothetical protein
MARRQRRTTVQVKRGNRPAAAHTRGRTKSSGENGGKEPRGGERPNSAVAETKNEENPTRGATAHHGPGPALD